MVDYVLVNSNFDPAATKIKPEWSVSAVGLEGIERLGEDVTIVLRDVVNPEFPLRHDPEKLSTELLKLGHTHRVGQTGTVGTATNGHHVVDGSDLVGNLSLHSEALEQQARSKKGA